MNNNLDNILYLDYAATTPTDQRVVDSMLPYFTYKFGNAASRTHAFGWEAEEAVKVARHQVAALIGSESEEITFTSGATEAINLALKGIFETYSSKGNHIITVSTEHKAVLDTCVYLESKGAEITYLPVDKDGLIDLEELQLAITDKTILVSIMYVNNETGVIQPIREISRIAHNHNALFMTDATQAVGKVQVNVEYDEIDILTCSAHKLYGPNGIGALYIKSKFPRIKLLPQMHGGGHERGFRSGTLNTPAIVGFGVACKIASEEIKAEFERVAMLSNEIEQGLSKIDNLHIHAISALKVPHIINFNINGIDAEALIIQLRDQIAISSGSACTSLEMLPSHVIMAMYEDEEIAYGSVRISLGRFLKNSSSGVIVSSIVSAVETIKFAY